MSARPTMTTDAPGPASLRLFFALWPDDAARATLAGWQAPLKALFGGRASPARHLHVTLVFLGNVAADRLEQLKTAAQEVPGKPFPLCLDAAHLWQHNHIVHAAPSLTPPELPQLVAALEERLRQNGFTFDSYPEYRPHATLLRHARTCSHSLPPLPVATWEVHEFCLVHSANGPGGVEYRILARFPLV